jgi:hypothetical protein
MRDVSVSFAIARALEGSVDHRFWQIGELLKS